MSEPEKDPLAVGLGALACGIGLGAATLTATQLVIESLRRSLGESAYLKTVHNLLYFGLLAALAVGVLFAWRRSRPLHDIWQRGVIAILAAFGSWLVGFLAAPLLGLLGLAGPITWLALTAWLGMAGSRWATKGAGEGRRETGAA